MLLPGRLSMQANRRSWKTHFSLFLTIQMAEIFYQSLFGHLWGILDAFELPGKSQKV
jgi:hypothetical protein